MFELSQPTKAKLIEFRTLSKKNRPADETPGVKLVIEQQLPNTYLDFFDTKFRLAMYEKAAGAKAAQGTLEGVEAVSDTPSLTQLGQKLGKVTWHHELTGYAVNIVRGIGAGKNAKVELNDAVLSNWRITCKDGGTFIGRYDIEAGNVPGHAWEAFAELKSRDFELTAKAPEITQQEIERDAIPPAPGRKPGAAERAAAKVPPTTPHKSKAAEAVAAAKLSPEAAWPFPKGGANGEKPPQSATTEVVREPRAGARTARGAAKTKAALAAGRH